MRKYKFLIVILFIIFFDSKLNSQNEDEIPLWFSEMMENLASDFEGRDDFSVLLDQLIELYHKPLNINEGRREDFEKIFFLSDWQIEELLFSRYQFGAFTSIFDLQIVKGFDQALIQKLSPFIEFGDIEIESLRRFKIKGDYFLRTQWVLETPSGYIKRDDDTTPFQGNKLKLYSRMELQPLADFKMGFVAEKDPGEPMFNNQINTMDFVAGYLSWQPKKILQHIVVGQYGLSSGQGLVLQSGIPPRKGAMTTSLRNRQASFRPSLSVMEAGRLNGIVAAFGNSDCLFVPFVSVQKIDGRLDEDENGNTFIKSIKTDGYHRTLTELSQRKTSLETIYGAQMKLYKANFIFEAGHMEYILEYPLMPVSQTYNRHYFRGRKNRNSWLAAEGSWKKIHFFGEAAFNNAVEPALWLGALYPLSDQIKIVSAYRRIPLKYYAPLGAPLTEATHFSGESGLYTGFEFVLPAGFTFVSYIDYFEHAWLKYQAKSPGSGIDLLSILTWQPLREWENTLRFRLRQKTVDQPSETPDFPVGKQIQKQWRLQSRYTPSKQWRFTTRGDLHFVSKPGNKKLPGGFYLAQDIQYKNPSGRLILTGLYAIMDVEEYDTRIYAYEPDVLYSFSTPAYYGKGSRLVLLGKWTIINRLDFWVRFSRWHYSNRDAISSGYTMIDGNVSRELRFQLRKRF